MNNVMYGEKLYPFDSPLTSRQRKTFVENLSLESLKYCFGKTYSDFFVDDKPDIQDIKGLVGIEVTEAISMEEAQIESEFIQYNMKDGKRSKECSKAIIEARGGKLDELSLSYPNKNGEMEKRLFQDALFSCFSSCSSPVTRRFKRVLVRGHQGSFSLEKGL